MLTLVCLEIALILTQDKCTVCAEGSIGSKNHFGRTRWIPYVTLVMWNLVSIHSEIVVVLVLDRCTICAKRAIGTEIVLVAPDGTPRRRGSSGCSFWFVWT
jgi:hypothetical protein